MKIKIICTDCGKEFISKRRGTISPAQRVELRRYCDKCLSIRQHRNGQKGALKSRRKGLKYIDSGGYVHINIKGSFKPEHRLVMENKLGRPLVKGEVVHHINGNRQDNKPENLELWLTRHLAGIQARDLICPHCGKSYDNSVSQGYLLKTR